MVASRPSNGANSTSLADDSAAKLMLASLLLHCSNVRRRVVAAAA